MTDDEEPRADHIELGRDPLRHTTSQRAINSAARLRSRLGRWFAPVVALVAIGLVGATFFAVAATTGSGEGSVVSQPSADGGAHATGGSSPVTQDVADPLDGIALGPPPQVPYYSGGELHWANGDALRDRRAVNLLVTRGGTSLLLTSSRRLLQFDGPALRSLASEVTSGPAISSDGRVAAWTTAQGRSGQLVLWDVVRHRAVAVRPIELGFDCCDRPGVQVVGIDATRRVYITAQGRFLIWSPPYRVLDQLRNTSAYGAMSAVTPRGPVFDLGPDTRAPHVYGDVADRTRFRPIDNLGAIDAHWSPFGDIVASVPSPETAIAQPLNGFPTKLDTPPTMRIQDLTWESASVVLVVVTDDAGRAAWLRCDASDGDCELAAELGESGRFKKTWAVSTNDPLGYL